MIITSRSYELITTYIAAYIGVRYVNRRYRVVHVIDVFFSTQGYIHLSFTVLALRHTLPPSIVRNIYTIGSCFA